MTVASQQALAQPPIRTRGPRKKQILTHWRFLIVPESLTTSRRPNRLHGQENGLAAVLLVGPACGHRGAFWAAKVQGAFGQSVLSREFRLHIVSAISCRAITRRRQSWQRVRHLKLVA
jgi:hypothetical protein